MVDKKSKKGKFYFVDNSLGRRIESAETRPSGEVYEIIASTKQLQGLPLLVIEDEAKEFSLDVYRDYPNNPKDKIEWKFNHDKNAHRKRKAFIKGYNKAKETYKFTEEDLRKAMKAAVVFDFDSESIDLGVGLLLEGFIKSLSKKELYVEVVDNGEEGWIGDDYNGEPFWNEKLELKITDNKIKAVWK